MKRYIQIGEGSGIEQYIDFQPSMGLNWDVAIKDSIFCEVSVSKAANV